MVVVVFRLLHRRMVPIRIIIMVDDIYKSCSSSAVSIIVYSATHLTFISIYESS